MADTQKENIQLEEGEIMRISVSDYDPKTGNYSLRASFEGCKFPMLHALTRILYEEFDMICLPKDAATKIGICIPCDSEEKQGEDSE